MQENIARSVLQKGLTKGFYKKVFLKTWDLLLWPRISAIVDKNTIERHENNVIFENWYQIRSKCNILCESYK